MSELIQTIVVIVLVAIAAVTVWRRLRATARGEAQCGKCPGCGATERRCDEATLAERHTPPSAIARRDLGREAR